MLRYLFIYLAGFALLSCNPVVEPLDFGQDECHFCKMSIVDQRYGAELLTEKGKVFKYDATECMINALCENEHNESSYFHSAYVIDFNDPGKLVLVENSFFLISSNLPSPMGANLSSFSDSLELKEAKEIHTGEIFTWKSLLSKIVGKQSCAYEF